MKVTSYLNLNFDDAPFPERVDMAAEAGVDGIEFYGWDLGMDGGESVADDFYGPDFDPDEVVDRIHEHGLELVYMSGDRPPLTDPDRVDEAVESIERSLELADEYGCRNVNVKTGAVQPGLTRETQRRNVVEVLRRAVPAVEDAEATLALEPLNPIDVPDHFLHAAGEGCDILDAVDSPDVRLLFDIYHEQLARGNILNSLIENASEYVTHFHVADPPARAQPGTGELNWENVFDAVSETGYDGYMGGEFIPEGDPIEALETLVDLGERY